MMVYVRPHCGPYHAYTGWRSYRGESRCRKEPFMVANVPYSAEVTVPQPTA